MTKFVILIIAFPFILSCQASVLDTDIAQLSTFSDFSYINIYFQISFPVLIVDLDGEGGLYVNDVAKVLMLSGFTTCMVSSKDGKIETVVNGMNKCFPDKHRYVRHVICMKFPTDEENHLFSDFYKESIIGMTTSPTVFLFYGAQDKNKEELHPRLVDFIQKVWESLRFSRMIAVILTKSGTPIFCSYDSLSRLNENSSEPYRRGILYFTKDKLLTNLTTIINKNLKHNFPLRIVLFERFATNYIFNNSQWDFFNRLAKQSWGYGGIDGFLMGDVVTAYKFRPIIENFRTNKPYGFKLDNGTVYGAISHIIDHKADIAFNSHFVKPYGVEDSFHFTNYISSDRLCYIVPKAQSIPTWKKIGRVYEKAVWIILLVTTILISILRWIQLNMKRRKKSRYIPLTVVVLDTHSLIIVAVAGTSRAPIGQRTLLTLCFLITLTVVSVYQSNLKAAFNVNMFYPDIDTLEELDKSDYIISVSNSFKDVFNESKSKIYQNLNVKIEKSRRGLSVDYEKSITSGAKMARLVRESDAKLATQTKYLSPTGEPRVHIVKECPISYRLSYIVSKNFPFKRQMSKLLTQLVEAGLPVWYSKITDFHITAYFRQHHTSNNYTKYESAPLKLRHVFGAFVLLFGGIGLATLALIGEMWAHRRNKRNLLRKNNKRKIT